MLLHYHKMMTSHTIRYPGWLALGAFLLASVPTATAADEQHQALPENRAILLELETADNSPLVMLRAAIRIKASREQVWAVLVSCEQALRYVPDIRECRVMEQGETADEQPFEIILHRLKPYFFLPSVNNIFRAEYYWPERIEFHRQGGELQAFQGSWHFVAIADDETVLYYQASVNLSKNLGQRGEMRILKRDVPQLLGKLRELVEHG